MWPCVCVPAVACPAGVAAAWPPGWPSARGRGPATATAAAPAAVWNPAGGQRPPPAVCGSAPQHLPAPSPVGGRTR